MCELITSVVFHIIRNSMAEVLNVDDKKTLQRMINEHRASNYVYKFELLFRATRDGLTNTAFHQRCDNKGATVTVVKNSAKFIYGGYTTVPWQSAESKYFPDCCSFLFRIRQEGHAEVTSMKYAVQEGKTANSVYSAAACGPTFGNGHDLIVFSGNPTKEGNIWKTGGAKFGTTYTTHAHTVQEYNGANFELEEVEVYSVKGKK
jgi:hypothetical protein